jgi:hypothetical protein
MKTALLALLILCAATLSSTTHLIIETTDEDSQEEMLENGLDYADTDADTGITLIIKILSSLFIDHISYHIIAWDKPM